MTIKTTEINAMREVQKSLLLFFVFLNFSLFAQDYSLSFSDISMDLIENANAVIRNHAWDITVEDVDKLTTKELYVVTIFNKIGYEKFTNAAAGYDNDSKIKSISAKFYDASGKLLKKYSKGKFTDISAVSNGTLYDDSRVLYVEYTPVSYPFTLEFEVEKSSKTTGFIPNWRPIFSYFLGVEKSTYKLTNKTNAEIRTKELNFEGYSIEKTSLKNGFQYVLTKAAPVKYESYSLGIRNLTPELLVATNQFALKGVTGKADNWKEFGDWMYQKLISGRDQLDEATKTKILDLTKDTDDPIEKARIVYQFVQDRTRYISVQVGIGGWEPIAANEVDRLGYGDCKGLTNYTKALLDVVGVESYYTQLYAGYQKDIDSEFAAMAGNHAILNIPNGGNDIWLECTSQTSPFGFLGDFSDDRDVLVVTPEGGVIKRTPSYLDEDNLQSTKATINLDESGNVKAEVIINSEGIQYDDRYYLEDRSLTELKKHYKGDYWSYNNNLEIDKVSIDNDKKSVRMKESLNVSISEYATVSSNDYLLKVNMFNRYDNVPKRYRNRKLPFKISRGFKDIDEFTFKLPTGYTLDVLPPEKKIESKFGTYIVTIEKIDATTIVYRKQFLLKAGEHPKEDYAAYRKFLKSVAKYENLRISLTKKS